MRIKIGIFVLIGLFIFQNCGTVETSDPEVEGFDLKAGAPNRQRINANEPVIQPYAAYLKVQARKDDDPSNNIVISYQRTNCEPDNWQSNTIQSWEGCNYEDLDVQVSPQITQEAGFVVWPRDFEGQCSPPNFFKTKFWIDFTSAPPPGQKYIVYYWIKVIEDDEGSDVPNNGFKHQRAANGIEVPGDGFNDADETYYTFYREYLSSNRKDLFIEFDAQQIPWIWNNMNDIKIMLQTIFNSAGINIQIFEETISNIEDFSDRNEIKQHLRENRNLDLQRRALHVVVLNRRQDQPLITGQCIQMQGPAPYGDGKWDYECYDAVYNTQYDQFNRGELDEFGCAIFWETFNDMVQGSPGLGAGWTQLEAFCHLVAHEIGHSLGVFRFYERPQGNIMSHIVDQYQITQLDSAMFFYHKNVDNIDETFDNCFSNAFNLRDILGVQTTSFRSGNIFNDNINPYQR
jgi:hypothetical protein